MPAAIARSVPVSHVLHTSGPNCGSTGPGLLQYHMPAPSRVGVNCGAVFALEVSAAVLIYQESTSSSHFSVGSSVQKFYR
ncbi:hypothetical protein CGMCC3_g1390 [Colletotrichum fructicola]|nr:uncharacterized protein CGMCC3_g1390 [Colletotrichum fructicola]KAE9582707.1 hypothetical protein CGMCC3_g1390 [Colletotrichum fructicola]